MKNYAGAKRNWKPSTGRGRKGQGRTFWFASKFANQLVPLFFNCCNQLLIQVPGSMAEHGKDNDDSKKSRQDGEQG